MRVVFMGTPDFSVGTLKELAKAGHEIVGVISQPDKPKGRGKNLQPTPVKEAAMELGLPVYQPKKVRDPAGYHYRSSFRTDHSERDLGNAKIRMHQCTRIPASGIPRCSPDPVGSDQRG